MHVKYLMLLAGCAALAPAADLFRDDFSRFPPGWLTSPVGTLNGAIQEYHYLPHRGVPLWPWASPIGHLDSWLVGDEKGVPYLEEQLDSTAKQWSPPQARRSLTRRLPHPRRRKNRRTVRRNAAIPTGTALRPGARFGSTIGQRAATHQGSATTGGADMVRPVSGNVGASTFWISPSRRLWQRLSKEPSAKSDP